MKKALLVYHSNICNKNCGINSYLYNIFDLLYRNGIKVDIFVPQPFDSQWDTSACDFIDNIFIDENNYFKDAVNEEHLINYIKRRFLKLSMRIFNFEKKIKKNKLDWIGDREIERFKRVIMNNKYEQVVFSYAYYAKLLDFVPKETQKIISVSDFLSIQQFEVGNYSFGEVIDEEIDAINKFDKAFFISSDEMFFFSNFLKNVKCFYVPHYLKTRDHVVENKSIDILFLGSDNDHNVVGIEWFLESVYPEIKNRGYNMLIAGKITTKIKKELYPHIRFIDYVEDLGAIYNKTKLAISPLKSGTGIKIKIVEAISYGLPVVCTSKSMVGLMEKNNNGCVVADEAKDFARAIIEILGKNSYMTNLSAQSEKFFNKYFNERYATEELMKIFK